MLFTLLGFAVEDTPLWFVCLQLFHTPLVDEWSVGAYHRELDLPVTVDAERANVSYGNGVLLVTWYCLSSWWIIQPSLLTA